MNNQQKEQSSSWHSCLGEKSLALGLASNSNESLLHAGHHVNPQSSPVRQVTLLSCFILEEPQSYSEVQ